MTSTAMLSRCHRYRYYLIRHWDVLAPACFVMLNPSTADATNDDPTIRRCIGFAKDWGCGGINVVNLFAWRATDPEALKTCHDPVGSRNDEIIELISQTCFPIVVAWGASVPPAFADRVQRVTALLSKAEAGLRCLGTTAKGHPKHPLFVPAATPLVAYSPPPAPTLEEEPTRACDGCGQKTPRPRLREVRVKAAGKANTYLPGVHKWCPDCCRDNRGSWKGWN